MKDIIRVHFRKKNGQRSTLSLDKQLSEMVIELGYPNIVDWTQRTYNRIIEESEKGKRSSLDKSLSRELQREALFEIQRAFQRNKERVKQKEDELQVAKETDPLIKHIIFAFEDIVRNGKITGQDTFASLNKLRKNFKITAEHYRLHRWSIEEKKYLLRLSKAINGIRRASPEGLTRTK